MQTIVLEKTPVYLTNEECEQFITFQKHRVLIGLLDSVGFFNLRSGSVQIHVNNEGKIMGIEKSEHFRA